MKRKGLEYLTAKFFTENPRGGNKSIGLGGGVFISADRAKKERERRRVSEEEKEEKWACGLEKEGAAIEVQRGI
nr:hypothetical protein Iba_chr05aCG4090 [Ipomoea batatas]